MKAVSLAHLGRHRPEEMAHPLLVLHVNVEGADHHDAAFSADTLATARELAGLHVTLHDVDAVLLVEGYARHLVETDNIVLADKPALASNPACTRNFIPSTAPSPLGLARR